MVLLDLFRLAETIRYIPVFSRAENSKPQRADQSDEDEFINTFDQQDVVDKTPISCGTNESGHKDFSFWPHSRLLNNYLVESV